jgi:hypothetical protein
VQINVLARIAILLALASVAVVPAAQSAPAVQGAPAATAPTGLRAFLLRADEPALDAFPRTPSFAWTPFPRARSYDFQLATSRTFDESTIVWSTDSRTTPLRVPAVAIPIALPWMTGNPYALYAHVRARMANGSTRWSAPFGFNMRWKTLPEQILPTVPGLVRWNPVEGATSYQVWFIDLGKVITTSTNVADEREYYSFHPDPMWSGTVEWRVRAVRQLYGTLPNSLPVVSVGPWSQTFVSTNPPVSTGPIDLLETASDVVGSTAKPLAHSLTPGFVFAGDTATNGLAGRLYRVYVSTDRQCVNVVFTGSVVGSPAYAPRTSGPMALPGSPADITKAESSYLADGAQGGTLSADLRTITPTEAGGTTTGGGSTTTSGTSGTSSPAGTSDVGATGSLVDLWDSGWPTGRYYWTVVPVREVVSGTGLQYIDAEVPQDACAAGRVSEFGKASQPATTSVTRPYASGLSPLGELVAAQSATPSFYGAALVAWLPALGASGYEVQWSKTRYPWTSASTTPLVTAGTSALLEGLSPGTWYYRVRGIDPYIPGPVKQMTWSKPVRIKLVRPTFTIQDGSVTTRRVKK